MNDKNKQERFLSGALDSINKGNMERAAALYEYYKEVLGGEKRIDEFENILNEITTKWICKVGSYFILIYHN